MGSDFFKEKSVLVLNGKGREGLLNGKGTDSLKGQHLNAE